MKTVREFTYNIGEVVEYEKECSEVKTVREFTYNIGEVVEYEKNYVVK